MVKTELVSRKKLDILIAILSLIVILSFFNIDLSYNEAPPSKMGSLVFDFVIHFDFCIESRTSPYIICIIIFCLILLVSSFLKNKIYILFISIFLLIYWLYLIQRFSGIIDSYYYYKSSTYFIISILALITLSYLSIKKAPTQ